MLTMPRKLPGENVRDRLAEQLVNDTELRHEVTRIAQGVRDGKPSDAYIAWKHEVNALARSKRVPQSEMLKAIIEKAIELAFPLHGLPNEECGNDWE